MTTNKQLREWLSRFPDDTPITVLTSEESRGGYYTDISVYHESPELPDVTMDTLKSWSEFKNVCIDVVYDYDKEVATGVRSITLGKAHDD